MQSIVNISTCVNVLVGIINTSEGKGENTVQSLALERAGMGSASGDKREDCNPNMRF